MSASTAVLAQMHAPHLAFPRVMESTLSTKTNASAAVLALKPALLALLLRHNSEEYIDEEAVSNVIEAASF